MNATDAGLREVDRLDVLVLVDNATDSLSTTPKHVVSEWTGLRQAGRLSELSGAAICCAHHGLSLLIRAHVGDETHTRSEEHTSELQSQSNLVCRLLLEKKKAPRAATILFWSRPRLLGACALVHTVLP